MKREWRNLPYQDWPEGDRRAWQTLLLDGDILDGRGTCAHWAEATRQTNLKHYSGWLGWLAARGRLEPCWAPADRVTPDQVWAYARELIDSVAPKTVSSYLRDLKVVIKVMARDRNWTWLDELTNRLKVWAKPRRSANPRPQSTHDMWVTVRKDLNHLSSGGLQNRRAQLAYRDALLVAVLLSAPVRLRNLCMIRIGIHLNRVSDEWHLRFSEAETKTGRPLHLVLSGDISDHIQRYLDDVRPWLPGSAASDRLWLACKGCPMAGHSIYDRVCKTTKRLFGHAISPHVFRTIAATTLAEASPTDALRARPLLGHARFETTQDHYIKACQIKASQKTNKAIRDIRNGK